jgi:hypothetical protein
VGAVNAVALEGASVAARAVALLLPPVTASPPVGANMAWAAPGVAKARVKAEGTARSAITDADLGRIIFPLVALRHHLSRICQVQQVIGHCRGH